MANIKKLNLDEVEVIEDNTTAELTKNDDIVEYIQPSSLDILRARYADAEEDASIRNEGFELAKKGGLIKKARPDSTAYGYYASPVSPKEEIRTDVDSHLSQVFDSTKSEFDADIASFSDINTYIPEPVVEADKIEESPAPVKKRATRTKKAEPVTGEEKREIEEQVQEITVEEPAPTINNRYGFNTNTRVIYVDESADDGIQRNTDDELSSAFVTGGTRKRRFSFWSQKKR